MGFANIKIPSDEIKRLKKATGEKTGQKAVHKALTFFLREARQRGIVEILQNTAFRVGYDPVKLRQHER